MRLDVLRLTVLSTAERSEAKTPGAPGSRPGRPRTACLSSIAAIPPGDGWIPHPNGGLKISCGGGQPWGLPHFRNEDNVYGNSYDQQSEASKTSCFSPWPALP
jgi:hypothetical protein